MNFLVGDFSVGLDDFPDIRKTNDVEYDDIDVYDTFCAAQAAAIEECNSRIRDLRDHIVTLRRMRAKSVPMRIKSEERIKYGKSCPTLAALFDRDDI